MSFYKDNEDPGSSPSLVYCTKVSLAEINNTPNAISW